MIDRSQKGKMDNSFLTVQEHLSKSNDIRPPLSNTIKKDEEETKQYKCKDLVYQSFPLLPLKGWWLLKLHLFCGIFRASRGEEVSGWSGVKSEGQEQEGSTPPHLLLIHISFAQLFYPSSRKWVAKLKGTPLMRYNLDLHSPPSEHLKGRSKHWFLWWLTRNSAKNF